MMRRSPTGSRKAERGRPGPSKQALVRAPSRVRLAELAKLPVEVMPPACLEPMLAMPGVMPAPGAPFSYEVKWDGYRTLVRCGAGSLTLCSRNGNDFSPRFPELAPLRTISRRALLLDGEITAVDQDGHAHFSALQTRMPGRFGTQGGGRNFDPRRHRVVVMLFDILHCQGRSTRALPWSERRSLLEDHHLVDKHWQTPAAHADGAALLADMVRTGQEGVIAKRRSSPYLPGVRSRDWVKIKNIQSDDFIVVGSWSSGKHQVSSLLLGCYATAAQARSGRHLRYCGKVGTGFDERERSRLHAVLQRQARRSPPCEGDLPREDGIAWCEPRLVVQIRFTEWTHDGALRHPSYAGERLDKTPSQVVHGEAAATTSATLSRG